MVQLVGNELLYVVGIQANGQPAATTEQITTGQIAALAISDFFFGEANTTISTVGNGVITAAALIGGYITRTGPVSAFTDTTDTAGNIYSALLAAGIAVTPFGLGVIWKNTTAFTQTLQGGLGVTISGGAVIPANGFALYFMSITSPTAVTLTQFTTNTSSATPQSIGALNTIGNGTITAALIADRTIARGGVQTANFTDTTDTAANILGGITASGQGTSFIITYQNNTAFTSTLQGGLNVTITGSSIITSGAIVEYLMTVTSATTISMQSLIMGNVTQLPVSQYTTAAVSSGGTFAAAQLTGAEFTTFLETATSPGSINTRTSAQMYNDIPNAYPGLNYMLRIIHGGTGILTIAAGSNVTINGQAAISSNTWREYEVSFATISTATFNSVGSGTA